VYSLYLLFTLCFYHIFYPLDTAYIARSVVPGKLRATGRRQGAASVVSRGGCGHSSGFSGGWENPWKSRMIMVF